MLVSRRIMNEVSDSFILHLLKINSSYFNAKYVIFDLEIDLRDLEHYLISELFYTKTNYARIQQALITSQKFSDIFKQNIAIVLQKNNWIIDYQQITIKKG